MATREQIDEKFANDPHHVSIATNRIQQSKLRMDLESKVDRYEFENVNLTKCSRLDLNAVADRISSLQ